jgi:hypothetical protein
MNKKPLNIAFCYPYTYKELQRDLLVYDEMASKCEGLYYHREVIIRSCEGRNIDMITVSSKTSLLKTREDDIDDSACENNDGKQIVPESIEALENIENKSSFEYRALS